MKYLKLNMIDKANKEKGFINGNMVLFITQKGVFNNPFYISVYDYKTKEEFFNDYATQDTDFIKYIKSLLNQQNEENIKKDLINFYFRVTGNILLKEVA